MDLPPLGLARELLPGAQVLATPAATLAAVSFPAAPSLAAVGPGGLAHVYGQGNAHRWGWLHADLGAGAVLESGAAAARHGPARRLPPVALLRLRVPGHLDWPRLTRGRRAVPRPGRTAGWTVSGVIGRRRLRVEVSQPAERCARVAYSDPDGAAATCVNTERADAAVSDGAMEGPLGAGSTGGVLQGRAHAEVGTRP